MSMSKKDFEAIARAIVKARKDILDKEPGECHADMCDGVNLAVEHIADYCARANPNFDRARFLRACSITEGN